MRGIGIDGANVAVEIALGYPAESWCDTFAAQIQAALEADPRIARAVVPAGLRPGASDDALRLRESAFFSGFLGIASEGAP